MDREQSPVVGTHGYTLLWVLAACERAALGHLSQKLRAQTLAHFILCAVVTTVMALPILLTMLYVRYGHTGVGTAVVPPVTSQSFSAWSTHRAQHQMPGQGWEAHSMPRAPPSSAWMDRTQGGDLCTGSVLNFGYA